MALDVTYTQGEQFPLSVTESAASGTLTYSGSAVFNLFDHCGNAVSGFTNLPAVMSPAPAQTLTVYYDLATSGLNPGAYVGTITIPLRGQDGIARTRIDSFNIYVREPFN